MDGNNIDNNDDEQQQQQQQAEYEQEQQAAADDDARRRKGRVKLISVLEKNEEFSFRTRNKIDILTERYLQDLENDIFDMLCEIDSDSEEYRGLDSDRDTEQEVETTIRFFPDVLSRQKTIVLYDDDEEIVHAHIFYPIQLFSYYFCREGICWRCSVKAVSFIPVLARLVIELGLFEEEERGGLLCQDYFKNNVIQHLMRCDDSQIGSRDHREEHHEAVDDRYLQVLIELRKIGLLKKEDIQRYNLLVLVCRQSDYFAEKRFRFLVEWDPNSFWHTNKYGRLSLHSATLHCAMQGLQFVFEYGIRYFPEKKGINLIFQQDIFGDTPFQRACMKHGRDKVMEVVEDTLIRYSETPLNISDALITAAIDENVHLDCVYFLLRRKPEVLKNTTIIDAGSVGGGIVQ
jgi:hypothetical protein